MGYKKCNGCCKFLSVDEFHIRSKSKGSLQSKCKQCTREYKQKNKNKIKEKNHIYYLNNKKNIDINNKNYANLHKKEKSEYDRQYRLDNILRIKEVRFNYYNKNRHDLIKKGMEIRVKNKEKYNIRLRKQRRARRLTDLNYKLSGLLRSRLYVALKKHKKYGSAVKDLGCSIEFLKIYLESKFQPGMNWNNHGKEWEIDHILPLMFFNLSDKKRIKKSLQLHESSATMEKRT